MSDKRIVVVGAGHDQIMRKLAMNAITQTVTGMNLNEFITASLPPSLRHPQKDIPCALPGCGEMTNHHAGYCCAAHKRAHKTMRKAVKRK